MDGARGSICPFTTQQRNRVVQPTMRGSTLESPYAPRAGRLSLRPGSRPLCQFLALEWSLCADLSFWCPSLGTPLSSRRGRSKATANFSTTLRRRWQDLFPIFAIASYLNKSRHKPVTHRTYSLPKGALQRAWEKVCKIVDNEHDIACIRNQKQVPHRGVHASTI